MTRTFFAKVSSGISRFGTAYANNWPTVMKIGALIVVVGLAACADSTAPLAPDYVTAMDTVTVPLKSSVNGDGDWAIGLSATVTGTAHLASNDFRFTVSEEGKKLVEVQILAPDSASFISSETGLPVKIHYATLLLHPKGVGKPLIVVWHSSDPRQKKLVKMEIGSWPRGCNGPNGFSFSTGLRCS